MSTSTSLLVQSDTNYYAGHHQASLAYTLHNEGITQPFYPIVLTNNEVVDASVEPIQENIDGLNAYALIPNNDSNELHIVFTGTNDLDGVKRDIEHGTAGSQSFNEAKDDLLDHVKQIINNMNNEKPIKLVISGHSLGGADAENFLALVLEAKANKQIDSVNDIALYSFCSPGINFDTVESAERHMTALLRDQNAPVHIQLNYGRANGDPVHSLGQAHIVAPYIPGKSNTNLVVVNKSISPVFSDEDSLFSSLVNMASDAKNAHTLDWFNGTMKNFSSLQHLSAQHPGQMNALKDELHNKSHGLLAVKDGFYNAFKLYQQLGSQANSQPEMSTTPRSSMVYA